MDETSRAIVRLLAQRRDIARQIGELKMGSKAPIHLPGRERQVLAALIQEGRKLGVPAKLVETVFREIMADSRRVQQEATKGKK
jgi:chorismate mutase/prephenate dehydrogenase